jgi:hypothetical protein
MKKAIARAISMLAFGIAITNSPSAHATAGLITGTVAKIKIQNSAVGNSYFTLKSTATVGQCTTDTGNVEALFPDDDRGKAMLSVVTAALLSGKSVTVMVDDANAEAAWGLVYCFAGYVQVSP